MTAEGTVGAPTCFNKAWVSVGILIQAAGLDFYSGFRNALAFTASGNRTQDDGMFDNVVCNRCKHKRFVCSLQGGVIKVHHPYTCL
jgi:hypothetical protein